MILTTAIPLALLLAASHEVPSKIHDSATWIWCEEGYLVNASWITYIDACWATDGYRVKVHLSGGNSCVVKYGFKTREEAEKWIRGDK